MKEVIRHGTKTFETTCNACGCEFRYERSDVCGMSVSCPDCGHTCLHLLGRPADDRWIPRRRWALSAP